MVVAVVVAFISGSDVVFVVFVWFSLLLFWSVFLCRCFCSFYRFGFFFCFVIFDIDRFVCVVNYDDHVHDVDAVVVVVNVVVFLVIVVLLVFVVVFLVLVFVDFC